MAAAGVSSGPHEAKVHVICNPAAGSRSSRHLLENRVLPLLKERLSTEPTIHYTEAEGDGERIGKELVEKKGRAGNDHVALVLLGGDGTTNEVLNGVLAASSGHTGTRFSIALVPAGTANALYAALYPPSSAAPKDNSDEDAWRLRSLTALVEGLSEHSTTPSKKLSPLTLFKVSVDARSQEADGTKTTFGHLVVSHALHASILADSEALRAEMPGVERFKVAAERNSINWVRGSLKVAPFKDGQAQVQRYDSKRRAFVDVVPPSGQEEILLQGPFVYLTAMVTDRLEPAFVPAPFSGFDTSSSDGAEANLQRPKEALDIVLIRPLRDPVVQRALAAPSNEWPLSVRIDFAKHRLVQITKGMYDRGSHVKLRYATEGASAQAGAEEPLVEDGDGEEAVEYWRVGGYEWLPDKDDDKAALTCVDGAIYRGARTKVTATAGSKGDAPEIGVWH